MYQAFDGHLIEVTSYNGTTLIGMAKKWPRLFNRFNLNFSIVNSGL